MKNKKFGKGFTGLLLLTAIFLIYSCSTRDPAYLSQWYTENYPERISSSTVASSEDAVTPTDEIVSEPRTIDDIDELDSEARPLKIVEAKIQPEIIDREETIPIIKGSLEEPRIYNYSNNDEINDYNVSSMIEGKLFKLVEDAYSRRDETEFIRLYEFFLQSFPQSGRKAILDEKWRSFFYAEELSLNQLEGSLVEVAYPAAENLMALSEYFRKLNEKGVESVQIEVMKLDDQPVYLFAKPEQNQGYYFRADPGPVVDDILAGVISTAHDNNLKVYVSFPLRTHPRLGHLSDLLMDSSWNPVQNTLKPNSKLDLLNPKSKIFLERLIDALFDYQIDGVVFKDDFTYQTTEGFSKAARHRYTVSAGVSANPNQIFVPLKKGMGSDFGILADEEFKEIALWRTREVKQLLWDLTQNIKSRDRQIDLGIEITPEMVLDEAMSVKWYSTGIRFLKDLDVDFFVLKWRKHDSEAESDFNTYKQAANTLRESITSPARVVLKVPLSPETKNVIQLNRRISFTAEIRESIENSKLAIGPVSRIKQYDFIN